jgi:putative oxidoreductase
MRVTFSLFYRTIIILGNFLQPFFLLTIRLFWGWQFFESGIGKFDDIGSIANYFASILFKFSTLSAYLAASTELLGGMLFLVGFGSRLVAIPLMITMVVALFTAHYDATSMIFDDPTRFLDQGPVTFLLVALMVFAFGPGMFSLDGLLKGKQA